MEAVVRPTHLRLSWGRHVKSVPYNGTSNLPVLCTAPGAQRAAAHISKYLLPWNKAYLIKDKLKTKWNHNLYDGNSEILPPELESTIPPPKSKLNTDVVKPSLQPLFKSDDYLTTMSACQNCEDSQSSDTSLVAGDKCKVCKPYASLSINARLLLHFHNKLDHIGMRELTDLAR